MDKLMGLFLWASDCYRQGNVLSLVNIIEPRKALPDYAVGETVLAKCPGFGKQEAVIAQIEPESKKSELSEVLRGQGFMELLASLNLLGQDVQDQAVPVQKEIQDSVQVPKTSSSTAEKPKAKRKLNVDAPNSNGSSSKKQTSKKRVAINPDEKQLQSIAEDMALTELMISSQGSVLSEEIPILVSSDLQMSEPNMTNESVEQFEPQTTSLSSDVIGDSLRISNGVTPRHSQNGTDDMITENSILRQRVATLEYHQGCMWNEIQNLKFTVDNLRRQSWEWQPNLNLPNQGNTEQVSNTADPVPVASVNQVPSVSADGSGSSSGSTPNQIASKSTTEETTYAGYTVSQLKNTIRPMLTEKKAAARLFRLLFSREETEGRSLTGKSSQGRPARPKLQDQTKLEILYNLVQEKFPFATREVVNITLRDLLKPSHANKN